MIGGKADQSLGIARRNQAGPVLQQPHQLARIGAVQRQESVRHQIGIDRKSPKRRGQTPHRDAQQRANRQAGDEAIDPRRLHCRQRDSEDRHLRQHGRIGSIGDGIQHRMRRHPGHRARPVEAQRAVHRRQRKIDARARAGQQQIVQQTRTQRKGAEKTGAEQHGRQPRIGPHRGIDPRCRQQGQRQQAKPDIGRHIQMKMTDNHPDGIDPGEQRRQQQKQAGHGQAQELEPRGQRTLLEQRGLRLLLRQKP